MNYRNRSTRCRHGFAIDVVGCPECGIKVADKHSQHLRRASLRRTPQGEDAPATYRLQGKRSGEGNTNRGFKY